MTGSCLTTGILEINIVYEKENSEFKPVKLRLKIDLVSYPARAEGLVNRIRDKYTLTLRNKFDALQEISETPTPSDEYENFVNVHLEAAVECIPTKQRAKSRIPWETLAVRKKRTDVTTASKCNWRNKMN